MDPFTNQPYAFDDQSVDPFEAKFNNGIREITIFLLIAFVLCTGAYAFLTLIKKKRHDDEDDYYIPVSWDDAIVYQVSFAICVFSLAVSAGSVLLLPISSISNEVLHRYPSSWYIKWLNSSLIHGLWNHIFLLSNFSLFLALPFAYLFCESEGIHLVSQRKGLKARITETMITLLFLAIVVLGFMYVLAALIDWDHDSFSRLRFFYSFLPFVYSCVSFVGVLLLLICTPIGFSTLFTLVGDLVIKPNLSRNIDEDYYTAKFEEENLLKKVANCRQSKQHIMLTPVSTPTGKTLRNGEVLAYYEQELVEATVKRKTLDRARHTSTWRRILGYPLIMLTLLALTGLSLLCVVMNVGQIVVGFRSLPIYQHTVVDLGITSLSSLGVVGVIIEVILIGYLFVTSLVGLYSIPFIKRIKPITNSTPLTNIILNCCIYVVLSSALPLLAKILGITNFDLLGNFSEVKWLGNFYLVVLCNVAFASFASLALFDKVTVRARQEIARRIKIYISTILSRFSSTKKLNGVMSPGGSTSTASMNGKKTD